MIVDDDPSIREIFTLLLSSKGYTVHEASGGRECIEGLRSVSPDLVLLDIMMHPVDGWETLARIRSNPLTLHVPAIMFSGKSPSQEEVISYGGWIEDYLMKPLTMATITRALSEVFERCRADARDRECYLKNGADPLLVNEYLQLRRFIYIRRKFSRELFGDSEDAAGATFPQKTRFDEITRILPLKTAGPGTPDHRVMEI